MIFKVQSATLRPAKLRAVRLISTAHAVLRVKLMLPLLSDTLPALIAVNATSVRIVSAVLALRFVGLAMNA